MPDSCHCLISVTIHLRLVGWLIFVVVTGSLSSINCNLPPWSLEHSSEALAAWPGAWRPHATRAWLGLSKDESREAEAPVGYGWVAAAAYAPAQIQIVRT